MVMLGRVMSQFNAVEDGVDELKRSAERYGEASAIMLRWKTLTTAVTITKAIDEMLLLQDPSIVRLNLPNQIVNAIIDTWRIATMIGAYDGDSFTVFINDLLKSHEWQVDARHTYDPTDVECGTVSKSIVLLHLPH